jgi:uncharacterized spore protein YtfJ
VKRIHPRVESRIKVGEPLKSGHRTLFPVAKVTIVWTEISIEAVIMVPVAIIVVEKRNEYLINLGGEQMTLKMLMKMEPALRASIDRAMGIHRIKVT